jgi:hypothetical protein
MTQMLKRLTILAARELEETVVEILLDLRPALPGFTTAMVAGHGEGFDQATAHERVRGRIDRLQVWMVLPADDVPRVLAALDARLAHSRLRWWVELVESMGELA